MCVFGNLPPNGAVVKDTGARSILQRRFRAVSQPGSTTVCRDLRQSAGIFYPERPMRTMPLQRKPVADARFVPDHLARQARGAKFPAEVGEVDAQVPQQKY
jgi:hypothetical protein